MIIDHCRDKDELERLFIDRPMQTDMFSFDYIINNPNLFCFYGEQDKKLKGFIFISKDYEGKLYLSGVSVRKNMADNKNAIIKVCEAYKQDIYADTDLKHAVYMLKQAGFKHLKDTIYIWRYQNGQKEKTST